jgi:hypothetical protein
VWLTPSYIYVGSSANRRVASSSNIVVPACVLTRPFSENSGTYCDSAPTLGLASANTRPSNRLALVRGTGIADHNVFSLVVDFRGCRNCDCNYVLDQQSPSMSLAKSP